MSPLEEKELSQTLTTIMKILMKINLKFKRVKSLKNCLKREQIKRQIQINKKNNQDIKNKYRK